MRRLLFAALLLAGCDKPPPPRPPLPATIIVARLDESGWDGRAAAKSAPASISGRKVIFRDYPDSRTAVRDFQNSRFLDRVDGLAHDRAAALRGTPAFRETTLAATCVLVLDGVDAGERGALASAIDPAALCRIAFSDPDRAARRILPPELRLPEPEVRPRDSGRLPPKISIGHDRHPDSAALASALRSALRRAGVEVVLKEAQPAAARVLRLEAAPADPLPLLATLKPFFASDATLSSMFDALEHAIAAEREPWICALELALLEAPLVVPLARGRIYSLVREGCPLAIDEFGRFVERANPAR